MSTTTWIVLGVAVAGVAIIVFILSKRDSVATPLGDQTAEGQSLLQRIIGAAGADKDVTDAVGVGGDIGSILITR